MCSLRSSIRCINTMCQHSCTHDVEFTYAHLSTASLPTPIIHTSAGVWTFTSPESGRKRYIVEVECSVRNITFVEKYMSVSANSEGSGRVAIDESCFGGLGQLYRVKVWAVSGHNISQQPAVRCLTPDGQCREGKRCTRTCSVSVYCCGMIKGNTTLL